MNEMNKMHEEFLNQLEWIDDEHIKGKHEPRNTRDGRDVVFSKNMFYRGLSFRIYLYGHGKGMGFSYNPETKSIFGYSEQLWDHLAGRATSKVKIHTRRGFLERALLSRITYLDWILDSKEKELERFGMGIVKTLKKTQKDARTHARMAEKETRMQEKIILNILRKHSRKNDVGIKQVITAAASHGIGRASVQKIIENLIRKGFIYERVYDQTTSFGVC